MAGCPSSGVCLLWGREWGEAQSTQLRHRSMARGIPPRHDLIPPPGSHLGQHYSPLRRAGQAVLRCVPGVAPSGEKPSAFVMALLQGEFPQVLLIVIGNCCVRAQVGPAMPGHRS
ncbi:hypothetical protein L209DRAFT_435967 [Thermothelomyces heterothallicus CBS 203.75]